MRRFLGCLFLLLAACGTSSQRPLPQMAVSGSTPDFKAPPYAAGMVIGQDYPYRLDTHCGVIDAFIDGRYWWAHPPLTDAGGGNPPAGFTDDSNFTYGSMRLADRTHAEFVNPQGRRAEFVPAPRDAARQECE